MAARLIEIREVSKTYNSTAALKNVSINIDKGELLVLLGSSGSGKSTLLKMINGLVVPTSGTVYFGGEAVTNRDPVKLRRSMGYVFQQVGLFPHLSVFENVSLVLGLQGASENTACTVSARCSHRWTWIRRFLQTGFLPNYPAANCSV